MSKICFSTEQFASDMMIEKVKRGRGCDGGLGGLIEEGLSCLELFKQCAPPPGYLTPNQNLKVVGHSFWKIYHVSWSTDAL